MWLHSHSFASMQTRMTTLTIGHAGASGPRHPVLRTGPYDTTGDRQKEELWVGERKAGEERRTQANKSVKNIQTFQWTLPFMFMMTDCQTFRFNCCQKRLRSIPGYILTVYPVKLFWAVSALSCHQLDLTELSQTQLKCGKTVSYLTWLFSYTYHCFADSCCPVLYLTYCISFIFF